MQKIKIITDSASDITKKDEQRLGIKVLSFPFSINGKTYRERIDFTNEQFYRLMDKYGNKVSIMQINAPEFLDVFRELQAEGWTDVIYISAAYKGLSAYGNAMFAADKFKRETAREDGPKMRVHIIDSKNYTAVYGYAVMQAALKAQKGETPEEIIEFLKEWFECAELHFVPMNLKYAKKSGLISGAAAFADKLLGCRPIIKIAGGIPSVAENIRGEKNIVSGLLAHAENSIPPQSPYIMIRGSSSERTEWLGELMTEKLGYPPEYTVQAGGALSCKAGHDITGFVFRGVKRQ